MKIIFAFLLVMFLVFSGYHLSFRNFRIPLFARTFYLTGLEYLFIGLLLGPQFLNVLDANTCAALSPVTALLLGWIGMLFGFQFEFSKLRRFSGLRFFPGLLEGLLALFVVSGSVYYCLPFIIETTSHMRFVISMVAGSAAACTAQTGLALIPAQKIGRNQSIIKILRYLSSIDGLVAMLALIPVFILSPQNTDTVVAGFPVGHHLLLTILFFAAILILYNLFLSYRREQSELALIIIGMVIFISGFASVMNFSPLLSNFFVGMCLVNLTSEKEKIYTTLVSIEKPVYLLLLVFLGSGWYFRSYWAIVIAAGYCLLRLAGKMIGGGLVSVMSPQKHMLPPGLGLGLMGQGGLPMAILLDFQQGFSSPVSDTIVGIILISIIYSDVLSPAMVGRIIKKGS